MGTISTAIFAGRVVHPLASSPLMVDCGRRVEQGDALQVETIADKKPVIERVNCAA